MRHGDFGNMNQQGGKGNALIGDVATYYFMVHPVARIVLLFVVMVIHVTLNVIITHVMS